MNDWDDIRYFLAVARSGNVTSAAKALMVNHSTVSRRIHALEEKHGVRLFERIPSGYKMTVAALDIYEIAIELENKNQQVSRQLFAQDSRLQGDIHLTMPHDLLAFCLIDELALFRQQQPDIRLKLSVSKGLRDLAAREADVAIRFSSTPPDYLIGQNISLLQHGIYANTDKLRLDKSVPIISWSGENSLPGWAQTHFPKAQVVMQVDDLLAMYAAVKAGIGVARMPCYLPDVLTESPVKRLPIEMPRSTWGVWILSHVDLRHTARVRCCREFLQEKLTQRKGLFAGEHSNYAD
ncbi:MAG: transcriptional regulatory protein [Osedax symbiont Rs2]|nr:MAG: transcriptional regulatory protein [Osedax symbiont Rs2]